MLSPKDRYENDSDYRTFVDSVEAMLIRAYFTPAEVREMAVLACIHYEMRHAFKHYTVPSGVNHALDVLSGWRKEETDKKKAIKDQNQP